MTDRIVSSLWWTLVMTFIVASAVAFVLLGYQSLLELIAQRWSAGVTSAGAGVVAGIVCAMFCRHKEDLLMYAQSRLQRHLGQQFKSAPGKAVTLTIVPNAIGPQAGSIAAGDAGSSTITEVPACTTIARHRKTTHALEPSWVARRLVR